MREENRNNETLADQLQSAENLGNAQPGSAFAFLKSLPPNYNSSVLESYKRDRESQIVDYQIAEDFTDSFRATKANTKSFFIPVSWTMTKAALVNLLGITSYDGYDEVNGVRFYAGLNGDNQLTLIAVSTQAGTGCNDDLTHEDNYPYYDYAQPCPSDCSNRGNLKVPDGLGAMLEVAAVKSSVVV